MVVKTVQITVLIEDSNSPAKPNLKAKHGLAYFIKAKIDDGDVSVMMDTGPTPEALLHNVDAMGIDLQNVDMIVLSHGHYDHTDGLLQALKRMKKRVPVVGHPTVFEPKLSLTPHLRFIGAPFIASEVESAGGIPLLAADPVKIADGITTTGEVPRTTAFEKVRGFWAIQNGRLIEDKMLDDLSLIIDVENKGLVVVAGCAHSGIINIIRHAQEITGNSKVHAVLGGFHLVNADAKRIKTTIDELEKVKPEFVGPCHCTGKKATNNFAETFGERCRILHSGDIIEF
ncbi:MAG TPA: MBL fold metallo-hydrolase [Candidatus Bathyarchaeota archaeon]|nr:MBL fold metallo-hydrolase [Candidatus Bathyarchaeota archaeon]